MRSASSANRVRRCRRGARPRTTGRPPARPATDRFADASRGMASSDRPARAASATRSWLKRYRASRLIALAIRWPRLSKASSRRSSRHAQSAWATTSGGCAAAAVASSRSNSPPMHDSERQHRPINAGAAGRGSWPRNSAAVAVTSIDVRTRRSQLGRPPAPTGISAPSR